MNNAPQMTNPVSHTTGPFHISVEGRSRLLVQQTGERNTTLCQVMAGYVGDAEARANARLFAAAPNLLKALYTAVEQLQILNDIYNFTSGDAQVNAEIAATGRAAIVEAGGEVPETLAESVGETEAEDFTEFTGGALR